MTIPLWLPRSLRTSLYSPSVHSHHLFLISSASVVAPCRFCPLLFPTLNEISLGISNSLEEISSLSHSIVFLCLFALITEEGFLIFLCYTLELCIQMGLSFLFSFFFHFSSQLFVRPPKTTILPFCISFSWRWS